MTENQTLKNQIGRRQILKTWLQAAAILLGLDAARALASPAPMRGLPEEKPTLGDILAELGKELPARRFFFVVFLYDQDHQYIGAKFQEAMESNGDVSARMTVPENDFYQEYIIGSFHTATENGHSYISSSLLIINENLSGDDLRVRLTDHDRGTAKSHTFDEESFKEWLGRKIDEIGEKLHLQISLFQKEGDRYLRANPYLQTEEEAAKFFREEGRHKEGAVNSTLTPSPSIKPTPTPTPTPTPMPAPIPTGSVPGPKGKVAEMILRGAPRSLSA